MPPPVHSEARDGPPGGAPVEAERLRAIAADVFGVDGPVELLPGERDLNASIREPGGARWILKLAPTDPPEVLRAQTDALRWLERVAPELPVPRVRAALDGRDVVDRDGVRLRMYGYLDGTMLDTAARHAPGVLASVGRLVGGVDRALNGFERPGLERPFRWNPMHGLDFAREHAPLVGDPERRRLLDDAMDRAAAALTPRVAHLRTGTIHGDANPLNVLVTSASADATAAGLIDFGDLMHSWVVAGPAIACAYAMQDAPDALPCAVALVAGAHAAFALPADELEAILPLALARLAVTVTNAARAQVEEPANAYLQVSDAPAWRLLERLRGVALADAAQAFREACYPRAAAPVPATLRAERERRLGPSLSVSYRNPLTITRGDGIRLFDEAGRAYIDCVNNVCHVGHCHPRVARAAAAQMTTLNTNTRYLHPAIVTYAERLAATLPDPLGVCFFVNSGTEANELALRLARAHTQRGGIVALDHGYHGNTQTLVDVSSYKCDGPGGAGPPPHVRFAACPDAYRGPHRGDDAGAEYARSVQRAIEEAALAGHPIGAFLAEAMPGCAGQIIPPPGYLAAAFDAVRAAGGVTIVDEVQTGFGRVGSHFWSFELQDVCPDIVTMGKPIGNGHPLGAVVTTPDIATSFDNGMEFFSTFGGNPVSCAVGLAVLDVIEAESLQDRARTVGADLTARLRAIQANHAIVGDVRGAGLFIGVELVRDRATREPAARAADEVVNRMRERGILLSTDGPLHNVIKIKPPLVMKADEADRVAEELEHVLAGLDSGS